MKIRMKVSDLVTILTEVSRKKRTGIYTKYGLGNETKAALQRALRRGRWVLA